MTGYQEAVAWLSENAPEWRMRWAQQRLRASAFLGGPTEATVEVTLVPKDTSRSAAYYETELQGEGPTHLAAAQGAIGALR